MKILIIGDGNSSYIIEQAKWLKKSTEILKVDLFTFELIKEQNEKGIYDTIISVPNNINFPLLNYFNEQERNVVIGYKQLETFLNIEEYYDIIQIHFIDIRLVNFINFLHQKGKKIVASIWGSDLLRSTDYENNIRKQIYENVDIITMRDSIQIINTFKNKFPNIDISKIKYSCFGSDIFNQFTEVMNKISKDECKQSLNLENDKIIVTIGYNAWEAHRHLEVLTNILKNPLYKLYSAKIRFFLPLSYGSTNEYRAKLISFCEGNNLDFVAFDKYLSDSQVVYIRYASDILINMTISDVFSNSLREYLYSKNIVITGTWLPYDELMERGFYLRMIDDINKVGQELFEVLQNFDRERLECVVNDEKLLIYTDWSIIIREWIDLYKTGQLN